jgi:predicted enzyme related to lactoylglutathione lyase
MQAGVSAADAVLGKVLWYELLTTDVNGARAFYTAVVGWTVARFEQGSTSGQEYHVWRRAGDVGIGGVMGIPQGMHFPPHWGMYVGVPKLEASVGEIERRGGSPLSPPMEVPTVGRLRTMKDPQGAAFSLLEPAIPGVTPDAPPEIGQASWHELYTSDPEAAMRFYTEVFRWEPTDALDMGEMGKYHMFRRGAALGGGMMTKPKEMAMAPPHWNFYFRVDDVNAAAERVKAHGGQVLNGPMEVPGGDWIINCVDPQGAHFSLHHAKK